MFHPLLHASTLDSFLLLSTACVPYSFYIMSWMNGKDKTIDYVRRQDTAWSDPFFMKGMMERCDGKSIHIHGSQVGLAS